MLRRHILIVEDEPDMRMLMAARLRSNGYDVTTAEDGEAGWEALLRQKPDLVLLDVRMPKLDGWQVLERIRANDTMKRLPVIMMTAEGETQSVMTSKGQQATDYFVKPFEPEELIAYVERYI